MKLQETIKAYQELDEKHKILLFKNADKHDRKFILHLRKSVGLDKGGFQPKIVVERTDNIRNRIDGFLIKESGCESLEYLIRIFFYKSDSDLYEKLNQFAKSSILSPEDLETFRTQYDKDKEPFIDLFIASVKEIFNPEITKDWPGPLSGLKRNLRFLDKNGSLLESGAGDIRAGHPVEYGELHKSLSDAESITKELQTSLEKASKVSGIALTDWTTREELEKIIHTMAEQIDSKQSDEEKTVSFLSNLAALISRMTITHKSSLKTQSLSVLRDETVASLKTKISDPNTKPVPGQEFHPQPRPWIEWSLNLKGEDFDRHQSDLTANHFEKLAIFLEDADISWLPAEETLPIPEIEKSDATPIELPVESLVKPPVESPIEPPAQEPATNEQFLVSEAESESDAVSVYIPEPVEVPKPEKPLFVAPIPPYPVKDFGFQKIKSVDIKTVLKSVPDMNMSIPPDILAAVSWQLFADNHIGLAYHISANAQQDESNEDLLPPPWALEVAAISQYIDYTQAVLNRRLNDLVVAFPVDQLFENSKPTRNQVIRLILAAASIRCALMSPESGADEILKQLHLGGDFPALHSLTQSVIEFSQYHQFIAPEFIQGTLSEHEFGTKKAEFIKKVSGWKDRALHFTTNYAAATKLWQLLLKPDHVVHDLIFPIVVGSEDIKRMVPLLKEYNPDKIIANASNKDLRRPQPIEGKARKMLIRWLEEAADLAREWIKLVKSKSEYSRQTREPIHNLIISFDDFFLNIIRKLRELERSTPFFPIKCAAGFTISSLNSVNNYLKNGTILKLNPLPSVFPINRDLLLIPDVHLTEEWTLPPEMDGSYLFSTIVSNLAETEPDLTLAFTRHCDNGDFRSAERILDWMDSCPGFETQIDTHRKYESTTKARHISGLDKELSETRIQLNEGISNGLISQTDFVDSLDKIEYYSNILSDNAKRNDFLDYFQAYQKINDIRNNLKAERASQTEKIKNDLQRLISDQPNIDDKNLQRIRNVLNSGDIHLASDYIERLRNRQSLDEIAEATTNHFASFFGLSTRSLKTDGVFNKLQIYLDDNKTSESIIVEMIRNNTPFGGLSFENVPEAIRLQNAESLAAWYMIKRKKTIDDRYENARLLARVFRGIGLNLLRATISPVGNRKWMRATCEYLNTRPVAQYGSQAEGKYKVVIDFALSNEEDLFSAFDKLPLDKLGEMIFYFGRLSEKQRKHFALLCLKAKRTIIVVDDLMMLYLASVGGRKIDALLACGLPFTYFMPYMGMSTGSLPPEMFFGRKNEVRALELMSPEGSSLVYGGRQIGKTFLLRQVEHRVHGPNHGRIALFIDLKQHGFGLNRHNDTLWTLIASEIKNIEEINGLFDGEVKRNLSFDEFKKAVVPWINQNINRRILLLLDEADNFLEADSRRSYELSGQIKGLMEATGLRFKAVFAGLHNVQRATRVINNPLAHLGRPLCIGPLLGQETREAQSLIESPLRTAGIFFDTPELAIRILAQSNYYPNLIQIYGQNLIQHALEKRMAPGSVDSPPYILTSEDINEVYERKALGDELRNKFRLTLDLDARFQLIANLLALYYEEHPKGFDTGWIYRNALELWPKGFREIGPDSGSSRPIPFDAFQTLLEEMTGLGILRKIDEDSYNLRSTNVVSLLGTTRQIENILEGFALMEPPLSYSPYTFRTQFDKNDKSRRSPFSADQEIRLEESRNSALIIAGSTAAGLEDVADALVASFGKDYVLANPTADKASFLKSLDNLTNRKTSGKTLLIVPSAASWELSWIRETQDRLGRYSRKDAFAGVLFLADPKLLWDVSGVSKGHNEIHAAGIDILSLHPWAEETVRIWMEDAGISMDPALKKDLYKATGYWPHLLRELWKKSANKPLTASSLNDFIERLTVRPGILERYFLPEGTWSDFSLQIMKCMGICEDPVTAEDVIGLVKKEEFDIETVQSFFWWAQKLDFARFDKNGWMLDPLLQSILSGKRP